MAKTWDDRFETWYERSDTPTGNKAYYRDAYHIGRKHQRKVCRQQATEMAEQTEKLKALLADEFSHSNDLCIKKNEYQARYEVLEKERWQMEDRIHDLRYDLHQLELKLEQGKWWQFWRKP